jgi:hypothetical protein
VNNNKIFAVSEPLEAWRIIGKDCSITAGVGSSNTTYKSAKADGDIIGVAVAENYARVDISKIFITMEINGESNSKPFNRVPLSLLLPDGEKYFFPFEKPVAAGLEINMIIESATANSVVATPIGLAFFHKNPNKKC